jgi:hypothetical protein
MLKVIHIVELIRCRAWRLTGAIPHAIDTVQAQVVITKALVLLCMATVLLTRLASKLISNT